MFDFSRTFRGVNTAFFSNFTDIFVISPTSGQSDFLLKRAGRAVGTPVFYTNKTDHHDITEILLNLNFGV